MKIIFLIVTVFISSLILFSCKKNNPIPPEDQPQVSLELEDVSCTEAWIKLSVSNLSLPADVYIYRDSSFVISVNLTSSDTILYIDSLLPNQSYSFHSIIQSSNQSITSDLLPVTTMDTTSQNFTWETFTFGNPNFGSSKFSDVAIVDENNIWAVGEINVTDTNQNGYTTYNCVHWNGNTCELKKIKTNACGGVVYPPIKAIFVFSSDNILFAHIDGSISHYNGIEFTNDCSLITQLNGSANKIWSISKNDYYVVSNNGFIAHYQNGQWSRIESGTTTNINDIWGINDSPAGNSLVLCTVTNRYQAGDHKLLSISGDGANEYITWPYTGLYGIWFNSARNIYIVGGGAYVYKNDSLETFNVPSGYYLTRVKGNNLNDIYIATAGAEILHFNGMDWAGMSNGIYGKYEGLDVKGNTVALVGYNIEGGMVGKAVVTIGKHFQ